jgi:exonuclease VII large subunit
MRIRPSNCCKKHCAIALRTCESTAKALLKHCESTAKALRKHCESTAKALRKHCESTAKALQSTAKALRKHSESTAKTLLIRCKALCIRCEKCEVSAQSLLRRSHLDITARSLGSRCAITWRFISHVILRNRCTINAQSPQHLLQRIYAIAAKARTIDALSLSNRCKALRIPLRKKYEIAAKVVRKDCAIISNSLRYDPV